MKLSDFFKPVNPKLIVKSISYEHHCEVIEKLRNKQYLSMEEKKFLGELEERVRLLKEEISNLYDSNALNFN